MPSCSPSSTGAFPRGAIRRTLPGKSLGEDSQACQCGCLMECSSVPPEETGRASETIPQPPPLSSFPGSPCSVPHPPPFPWLFEYLIGLLHSERAYTDFKPVLHVLFIADSEMLYFRREICKSYKYAWGPKERANGALRFLFSFIPKYAPMLITRDSFQS